MKFEIVTTKNGDSGVSALYNGTKVQKDNIIFHVLGTFDELNSHLGLIRSLDRTLNKEIILVQKSILAICSVIANPDIWSDVEKAEKPFVENLEELENIMSMLLKDTVIKPEFILPGGNRLSAEIDIARTVCRRSERLFTEFINQHSEDFTAIKKIVNRLSDFLFILARNKDSLQSDA